MIRKTVKELRLQKQGNGGRRRCCDGQGPLRGSQLGGDGHLALQLRLVSLKRLLSAIFQVVASVVFGQTVLEKRRRGSELGTEGSAGGRLGRWATRAFL